MTFMSVHVSDLGKYKLSCIIEVTFTKTIIIEMFLISHFDDEKKNDSKLNCDAQNTEPGSAKII